MGKSGIFFFRCVCWFENWNWRSWVVFPYPPSVAKFYPVNRTNHAKQSDKQKESAAWTAKWGVPLYLAAPSWNTCAFYGTRHRRPPSNCWPSLGLWKKKNGYRRAINTYGKCTPEKIHLIIWAHFKFPPELFPDVAQAHFIGQSRSDCTWNGKCTFTVNPFGQYTNLPKINTLFFNCTSISCCCENNLLRCVNQVFFGLRHYTKTHVETVRSRQATAYFDKKKNPHLFKMCCWQLTAHQSNLEMKICDAEVRLFI